MNNIKQRKTKTKIEIKTKTITSHIKKIMPRKEKKNVVVIGAGVSGLTSALVLLETYNLNSLYVISSELPGDTHAHDYTSPWAGGNWMSFVKDPVKEKKQIKYDAITYRILMNMADTVKEAGIRKIKAKIFCKKPEESLPWYISEGFVENISMISPTEVKQRNLDPAVFIGYEYDTVTVTPVIYCHYLRNRIEKLGGKILRTPKIDHLRQYLKDAVASKLLPYKPDLIVNCSGLGAIKVLSDLPGEKEEIKKIYPVKGQIVVIQQDLPYQLCVDNLPDDAATGIQEGVQFSHIFPRGDGYSIMGGIMVPNDWSNTVSPKVSESIMNNIARFVPEFSTKENMHKLYDYAALRPGRKGGVRVEYKEYYGGELKIVHNYGIGGAGYQASYGLSAEVAQLASKALGAPSKCPFKL